MIEWIRSLLSSDGAAAIVGYLVLPVVLLAIGFFACIAFQSAPWIPVALIWFRNAPGAGGAKIVALGLVIS